MSVQNSISCPNSCSDRPALSVHGCLAPSRSWEVHPHSPASEPAYSSPFPGTDYEKRSQTNYTYQTLQLCSFQISTVGGMITNQQKWLEKQGAVLHARRRAGAGNGLLTTVLHEPGSALTQNQSQVQEEEQRASSQQLVHNNLTYKCKGIHTKVVLEPSLYKNFQNCDRITKYREKHMSLPFE